MSPTPFASRRSGIRRSGSPRSGSRLGAISSVALAAALLVGGALIPTDASAQGILRGIKKKASDAVERKANQKVDQKIDEAAQKLVDRSFDSVFGDPAGGGSGADGKSGGSSGSARIFAMLPNAPTEAHYDFDAVFTYEMESMPKGKPSKDGTMLMEMNFNSDGKYMGTRIAPEQSRKDDSEVFAIFDIKNESMVMLLKSESGKASMAYSWKEAQRFANARPSAASTPAATAAPTQAPNVKPMTFSSLGKRTIAGYSAEGYKGENEDGDVELWVSNDPSLQFGRMMGASASMKQVRGVMPGNHPAGMLLEVTSTDRKDGDKSRMTIKSIDTKANVRIDMSDYPRIGQTKK